MDNDTEWEMKSCWGCEKVKVVVIGKSISLRLEIRTIGKPYAKPYVYASQKRDIWLKIGETVALRYELRASTCL